MVLDAIKIEDLYGRLVQQIKKDLYQANREQDVESYLKKIHYEKLIQGYNTYYDKKRAKIVVIGDAMISVDDMRKIAKKNGINPQVLEFYLDYDRLTNFNFNQFRNNPGFSDIIIGPNPHKVRGIEGYSSAISMIQQEAGQFPKLTIAEASNELKITKTSFTKAIQNTQMYLDILG